MRYAAHAAMTDPGRGAAELWRLCLGIVMAIAVMIFLTRGVLAVAGALIGPEAYGALIDGIDRAETPLGLLLLLLLMGAMALGAVVVAELLHKRSAASLFGPRRRFWGQFWQVSFFLLLVHVLVAGLPPWPLRMASAPGLPAGQWLALLPLTLGALMVQVSAEEVFFRGYIQSQLAARLSHPAVWLVLPSALFAFGHYSPELYGGNALWIVAWAFFFGVAAADLTARAGTLGPAVALHLVNNFMAMGVMSLQGEMSGLALMKLPFGPDNEAALAALLPADLAMLGISWLAARLALRV